jgi:hypothetical protein
MYLHRVTPTWEGAEPLGGVFLGQEHDKFEPGFSGERDPIVVVKFDRFGGGTKRHSDYEVGVSWEDVEKIIQLFCESGRTEAANIRHALDLAEAVKKVCSAATIQGDR